HLCTPEYTHSTWETAFLCWRISYSLQCYTCSIETSNSKCMTATTCSSGYDYCMTNVITATLVVITSTVISKMCAPTCTPNSTTISGSTDSRSCCTTDLCNTSG
ncbi:unnamed protein product, partial [Staurois parvus]